MTSQERPSDQFAKDKLLHDVIQWDIRNWSRALDFWEEKASFSSAHRALALGERHGGLSLWLGLKGVQVICSDIHATSERCKALHSSYELATQVPYMQVDAVNLPFDSNAIDIVIFKSMLGSLNSLKRQHCAIREAHRVLRKGGVLLFAENLAASPLHKFFRSTFNAWASGWRYPDLGEIHGLCSPFTEIELKCVGFLATFGRSERQRTILAKIDARIEELIPKRFRYIVFGACVK